MNKYLKEHVSIGELAIYKLLTEGLTQKYNKTSSVLVLPRALNIDETDAKLNLPYYEGETFNVVWTERNGGGGMDLSLAHELPLLLQDLANIDPLSFMADDILSSLPKLIFDHAEATNYFGGIVKQFAEQKIISIEDYNKITKLLELKQTTEKIVNNGDFYPRNFIRQANGQIVLIDWEVWNNNSPFYVIDHPENVAAVVYVHMWGNPEWREVFKKEVTKHMTFDAESFNKGIAMKALTLAGFFRKHQELFSGQINILKSL